MISKIAIYSCSIIGYIFLCRFSSTLVLFLSELKDELLRWANSLKENFHNSYLTDCKKPWDNFNKTIAKDSVERKDLITWQSISVVAFIFNGYMLAQFINAVSPGLSIALTPFWFPFQITYGTLASVFIVGVEIWCGSLYCRFYFDYEKNPNLGIYGFLKFIMVFVMICVMTVECIFWARVSVVTEIGAMLGLGEGNILNNFIDYFLALFGAAITLFEFGVGYMLFVLREFAPPKSVLGQRVKYFLSSSLYLLIYFVPNIFCRLFYGMLLMISWLLKLFVLPGNFIYENIKKKYS